MSFDFIYWVWGNLGENYKFKRIIMDGLVFGVNEIIGVVRMDRFI